MSKNSHSSQPTRVIYLLALSPGHMAYLLLSYESCEISNSDRREKRDSEKLTVQFTTKVIARLEAGGLPAYAGGIVTDMKTAHE